jgi:enoyl-CoA hydratase/carnithine racemase
MGASMSSVTVSHSNNIATAEFARGKVNAFDEELTAELLYTGDMYSVAQAHSLGLVDQVCAWEELYSAASAKAVVYISNEPGAFAHTKHLLRRRVVEGMESAEADSIDRFIELWYSDATREIIRKVEIRS